MVHVQIEYGSSHVLQAQLPALPHRGDRMQCSFPASGVPLMHLVVTDVWFHQPRIEFEGRDCPEPFSVVIATNDDPEFADSNRKALERALGGAG